MAKGKILFRQVSDVAEELNTPQHTLRYWENQFNEVMPLKRAGNRRHYRAEDVALLAGIKKFVHEDGLTLKAVKRIFSENGPGYVRDVGSKYLDGTKTPSEAEAAPLAQQPGSADAPNAADGPSTDALPEASDTPRSNDPIRNGSVDERGAGNPIDLNALRSILERLKDLRNRMAAETS